VSGLWAGIDWSEHLNDVAVVDRNGVVVARARVRDTPQGVKEILRLLAGLRSSHRHSRKHVPIAIEISHGLLVEALRRSGQTVIALNPLVVAHHRHRISPAKLKSDKGDAALLADILRMDGARHRPLPTNTDVADALTERSRTQLHAQHSRQQHYNRLRSVLREVHPAAARAWADLPGNLLRPEARAVLALGPTPATASRLTRRVLRAALADAGRTRLLEQHADRLFTLFREPILRYRPAVEDAHEARVRACLASLDLACHTLDQLTTEAENAFLAHPHAPIYRSFPGIGALTGARLLGEIGDDPTRFADARGLLAYAGAAPVTWASGSSKTVRHRVTANKILKATGHMWAFATLTRSPGCRGHYDRRRATGERHAAALRNLYARLLRCLHHCLATGIPYDETHAFPTR
jgi:transposase